MALTTDLQTFYPLQTNINDLWNSDNGTNAGGVFGTYTGVQSIDFLGSVASYAWVAPSAYNSTFGTGDFSISVWVNPDITHGGIGISYAIISRGLDNFELTIYQGNVYWTIGGSGQHVVTTSGAAVSVGTWQHIALVRTGGVCTIHIDDAIPAQTTAGTPGANSAETGVVYNLHFGVRPGPAQPANDKVCDAAFWKKGLSGAEITAIYAAGAGNMMTLLPLELSLVSYWPFDSSTNDAFGSDNGTGTGGLAYAASMAGFSNAIDCSGTDYVTFGAPAYGTSSLTFSYWVQPAGLGAGKYQIIGDNRTGSYVGISIFCNGPNDFFRCELSSGAGYSNTYSTSVPVAGTWYHLVVVVDKSTNTQRMYVNGVLQSNASDSPSISGYGSLTNSTFYIGTANTAGISIWEGLIDDAAWWTRALTPAEITAIYNAGAAASPLSSLLPFMRLEGQFGSMVHSIAATDARLEGQFGSMVHTIAATDARLEGQFGSMVHTGPPPPTAIVPDIAGAPLVPATFDGSASTTITYYHWSWVSVPGGSAIANAPVPFPDNQAATPIDMTGNVALYHFEGVATDSSGEGNDLTAVPAPFSPGTPTYVTGKVGAQAADLNGTSQYFHVDLGADAPTTDGTIACWFKLDGSDPTPANQPIIGLGPTAVTGTGLWRSLKTNPAGFLAFAGYGADILSAAAVVANQWYHVVLTWASTDDVVVYLDGVAVATQTLGALNTPSSVLSIGAQTIGASRYADCKVDEVAVWTRVLSATEIANIHTLQSGTVVGIQPTYTFTPDVVGTYTINLEINPTTDTDADAVIASGGGPTSQGNAMQGKSLQGGGLQGNI